MAIYLGDQKVSSDNIIIGGDMFKSDYDPDNDGIVDTALKFDGYSTDEYYEFIKDSLKAGDYAFKFNRGIISNIDVSTLKGRNCVGSYGVGTELGCTSLPNPCPYGHLQVFHSGNWTTQFIYVSYYGFSYIRFINDDNSTVNNWVQIGGKRTAQLTLGTGVTVSGSSSEYNYRIWETPDEVKANLAVYSTTTNGFNNNSVIATIPSSFPRPVGGKVYCPAVLTKSDGTWVGLQTIVNTDGTIRCEGVSSSSSFHYVRAQIAYPKE